MSEEIKDAQEAKYREACEIARVAQDEVKQLEINWRNAGETVFRAEAAVNTAAYELSQYRQRRLPEFPKPEEVALFEATERELRQRWDEKRMEQVRLIRERELLQYVWFRASRHFEACAFKARMSKPKEPPVTPGGFYPAISIR